MLCFLPTPCKVGVRHDVHIYVKKTYSPNQASPTPNPTSLLEERLLKALKRLPFHFIHLDLLDPVPLAVLLGQPIVGEWVPLHVQAHASKRGMIYPQMGKVEGWVGVVVLSEVFLRKVTSVIQGSTWRGWGTHDVGECLSLREAASKMLEQVAALCERRIYLATYLRGNSRVNEERRRLRVAMWSDEIILKRSTVSSASSLLVGWL